MSTALQTLIRNTLAASPFPPAPDYSATAHDIAAAIDADFDVHPKSAAPTAATPGLCWNVGPTPVTDGTPGNTPLCELRSGHTGAHEAGTTHWGIPTPPLGGFAVLAGRIHARQADLDLALAQLASALTSTPHTLEDAIRLLASYVYIGGDISHLPALAPTHPVAAARTALAASVDTSSAPISESIAKAVQGNDVAGVVIDQFVKHWPDLYPGPSLRFGIADALWDAGYRSNITAAAQVPIEEDQRLSAWDELARHPFFRSCYADERPLIDSMLAKLHTLIDNPIPATPSQDDDARGSAQ